MHIIATSLLIFLNSNFNDKRINKINAENKNDILKKPRCLNFKAA